MQIQHRKVHVTVLISDELEFKTRSIGWLYCYKKTYFLVSKGSIYWKTTFLNLYISNNSFKVHFKNDKREAEKSTILNLKLGILILFIVINKTNQS